MNGLCIKMLSNALRVLAKHGLCHSLHPARDEF